MDSHLHGQLGAMVGIISVDKVEGLPIFVKQHLSPHFNICSLTFESVFEKHIPDISTIWTQVLTYNKHINFLVSGFNGTSFYASPTRGVHGFTL